MNQMEQLRELIKQFKLIQCFLLDGTKTKECVWKMYINLKHQMIEILKDINTTGKYLPMIREDKIYL